MNLGLITDEPISVYHQTDAISSTKVKYFRDNFPIAYWHKYVAKDSEPEPRKPEYDFGHAVEARIYGVDTYAALVAKLPFKDYRTDKAKEWRAEQWAADRVCITEDEDKHVNRCYDAVMRNPDARAIVEASKPQVTFRERLNSVVVQCRSDLWCPNGVVLPSDGLETGPLDCDIKTTSGLNPGNWTSFDSQVESLGYAEATVFYRYVIRLVLAKLADKPETSIPFVRRLFIVVDKGEWPQCTVYQVPQNLIDAAENELIGTIEKRGLLPQLIECYRKNEWPGAPIRKMIEPGRTVKWKYPDLFP